MKMAKPSSRDIDAGGELLGLLDAIDERWGGPWPIHGAPEDLAKFLQSEDESFDSENTRHLQVLYNHLAKLLRAAPNVHGRVLGGMCYCICWDKNQILDPALDHLALHPDLLAGMRLLDAQRADFLPKLESDARAAVAETIEQAAARHLAEMGAQRDAYMVQAQSTYLRRPRPISKGNIYA